MGGVRHNNGKFISQYNTPLENHYVW